MGRVKDSLTLSQSNESSKRSFRYRAVAQLVARVVRDDEVVGSSPASPTMREKIIALVILALLTAGGGVVIGAAKSDRATLKASSELQQATIKVGKKTFTAELALSVAEQAQGLSNRPSMPKDHGMLFVFTRPTSPPFWMKDMQFSIDIVWILRDRVVGISPNLPIPKPGTKPEKLQIYSPPSPVDYVLELRAGQSRGVRIDDIVTILNPQAI